MFRRKKIHGLKLPFIRISLQIKRQITVSNLPYGVVQTVLIHPLRWRNEVGIKGITNSRTFLPRDAMHSATYAVLAEVAVSVRPTRSYIVSKRVNIG